MKSDVKAVRVTGTGAVFAGRTRLRGLILVSDGWRICWNYNSYKITQIVQLCFKVIVPNGDVFAFNIPEDGVVFPGGMKVSTITNITAATLLIDK